MPTFIALLRAVNVGGTGKLTMEDFRSILTKLGYTNVETYIQSGNAVFHAKGSAATVHKALSKALSKHMGAPVDVILRTHTDFARIIDANPFAQEAAASGARVHVGFLVGKVKPNASEELERLVASYPTRCDSFHLTADALYLHLPDGAADTKFTPRAVERALSVASTARNWNTVLKLHTMSNR